MSPRGPRSTHSVARVATTGRSPRNSTGEPDSPPWLASVWAGWSGSPRLHVLNNSGEPISGLRIDATAMRGSSIAAVDVVGSDVIHVPFVPPTAQEVTRPLPEAWLSEQGDADGTEWCIMTAKFQDALGDFWDIAEDDQVALSQTAEGFESELLREVESASFGRDG